MRGIRFPWTDAPTRRKCVFLPSPPALRGRGKQRSRKGFARCVCFFLLCLNAERIHCVEFSMTHALNRGEPKNKSACSTASGLEKFLSQLTTAIQYRLGKGQVYLPISPVHTGNHNSYQQDARSWFRNGGEKRALHCEEAQAAVVGINSGFSGSIN